MDELSMLVGGLVGAGLVIITGILVYLGLSTATWYNRRKRSNK